MIDNVIACICKLWYIPPDININNICSQIIKYLKVDILFYSVENQKINRETDDLVIIFKEHYFNNEKRKNCLFLSNKNFEIETIYQEIVEYYK